MRILSTRFRTLKRLENFIKQNIDNIYIDIFVHIILPEESTIIQYEKIYNFLKKFTDEDKIFALYSDAVIINSSLSQDIVINFFVVEKGSMSLSYHKNIYDCKELKSGYFYLLFGADFDKKSFLSTSFDDIDLIGTFYNKTILFGKKRLDSGVLVLKIKKDFEIDIKVVKDFEFIGRELKINGVKNGLINKIENFSPCNLYSHYLTDTISKDIKRASYTFPLLKLDKSKVCSSLILNHDNNGIKVEFDVKEGDIVKLGYANSLKFYKNYDDTIKYFDGKFSDVFMVIGSVAKKNFFKKNGFEFDSAIGFFSLSEAVVYKNRVYDLTHSVIMINIDYNKKNILKNKRYRDVIPVLEDFAVADALSNIAKVSSLELEELNKKLEKKVKIEVEKNLKKDSILIHRSRLAQMGEMMSLIAHQWKQPLSAISATSSGLHIKIELDMYDKEFFLKSLTKIEELVNHLSTTIDDFSNFFKPSKLKKEFYIYEAINKALSIATYSLSKHSIDLVLDIDKSIMIKTYQNELIQVLLNIIKNAENILIKRDIKEPKIYIRVFKKNKKNIIEIEDNAGGVDKKIISKIFEPYFSTKATKDSTGLGLYMSRFIVEESLGGKLLVRNSKKGAVFSIILV